jgi:hypothetical protein
MGPPRHSEISLSVSPEESPPVLLLRSNKAVLSKISEQFFRLFGADTSC